MVIQDIVFPEQGICDVNEMYYRGDAVFIDNALFLSAGKKVSLGTYYNAFSIGKWRKYTRLTSLTIRLFFEKDSDISIKCVHSTARITDPVALTPRTQDQIDPNVKANYEEWPIEVKKDTIDEKEEYSVHFSKLPEDGILFIEIEATTDVVLLGGQYETDCNEINPARIAIGICTFKREEAVKANVHKIINEVLRNPD
ncbi:MAG: hypothetical protein IJ091_01860, partial [Oscillospiraceae bacterium]|nr:hypothetical protein [Oscillospiraceae bacterium]